MASAPISPISAGDGDDEARKQLVESVRLYREAKSEATPSEEKASKYAEALEFLQSSAEAGNTNAQAQLGLFHEEGVGGLPKDVMKATEWLERAAAGGSTRAQAHLGLLYMMDEVVPQDLPKAKALLTMAAEQEDDREEAARAMLCLGMWPAKAQVPNNKESVHWLIRGIEAGKSVEPQTDSVKEGIKKAEEMLEGIAERQLTVEIHGHKKKEFNGQKGEGAGPHTACSQ